jgi:hypothetical protein
MANHPNRSKATKPLMVGETVTYKGERFFVQSAPAKGRIAIYSGQRGTLNVWRSAISR